MKTVIYYFSGTGNSLSAAKTLAGTLGDCELVPVQSLAGQGEIRPGAERAGIACPVYFAGLPVMVAKFAARLDCSQVKYTFALLTYGGSGSSSALRQLDGIMKGSHGRGLDGAFSVKMPGNYILMYGSPSGEKQAEILASAGHELKAVAASVGRCEPREIPKSLTGRLFHALFYSRFAAGAHARAKKFSVNDACTSCGTCVKVCPAGNIELVDGRPSWDDRCEVCCACIHLCPAHAIQAGTGTKKRPRYRNPSVSIRELEQGPR